MHTGTEGRTGDMLFILARIAHYRITGDHHLDGKKCDKGKVGVGLTK